MANHRIYCPLTPLAAGDLFLITGEEARHALRVKRVEEGETVEVLDGAGTVVTAEVAPGEGGGGPKRGEVSLNLLARGVRTVPPERPRLEVWTATPKGGRVDEMIDGLSQVGAAAWSPLATSRGVVSPREVKVARLERVAAESSKQCGRAWLMRVGAARTFSEGLLAEEGVAVLIADVSGGPLGLPGGSLSGAEGVRLLVGPEGGWTGDELAAARAAGARVVRLGVHVMRIETAAVVGAGMVMGASRG